LNKNAGIKRQLLSYTELRVEINSPTYFYHPGAGKCESIAEQHHPSSPTIIPEIQERLAHQNAYYKLKLDIGEASRLEAKLTTRATE
jgi:hypothetical protein